jgi:hypothetical protein
MGSAAGFYSVIRTVPIVDPVLIKGYPLWEQKPLRFAILDPDTPDLLRTAAIIDTAALTGKLVDRASAWPLCSLAAAMHHYGPALRAISVLLQKDPQASLPLPPQEELTQSLRSYRQFLGDLPEDEVPVITPGAVEPAPAAFPSPARAPGNRGTGAAN